MRRHVQPTAYMSGFSTTSMIDDRRYALDHLEVKLFPVAATMQTETGRRMAEERAEWMESFRTRLLHEIG